MWWCVILEIGHSCTKVTPIPDDATLFNVHICTKGWFHADTLVDGKVVHIALKKAMSCVSCGYPKTDKAHIKSKGSGGGTEDFNILELCRVCHDASHRQGWWMICETSPRIKRALREKGWSFNEHKRLIREKF